MINNKDLSESLKTISNALSASTSSLSATLVDVADKFKAAESTTLGKAIGEVKGGIQSLTQDVDNAVDALDSITKPVISKLDASASDLVQNLKTDIPSGTLTNIDKVFDSSKVKFTTESTDLSTALEKAKPGLENATAMLKEVIADGSVEAQAAALKKVTGLPLQNLTAALDGIKPPDLQQPIDEMMSLIEGGDLVKGLDKELTNAANKLKDLTGGLNTGNLLKNLTEGVSSNIKVALNSITGLSATMKSAALQEILKGNVDGAINDILSQFSFPNKLAETQFRDKLLSKLPKDIHKSAYQIGVTDSQSPPTGAKVVDIGSKKTPMLITSEEELVKYLQTSTREITTALIGWTGTTLDLSNIGAEDIILNATKKGNQWPNNHLYILTNGEIQAIRPLDLTVGIDGDPRTAYNIDPTKYSLGVSFVGGYNCHSSKYNGNTPPPSELSPASLSKDQISTFHKVIRAFYKFVPAGDVFSYSDIRPNTGADKAVSGPGFNVTSIISRAPYNKRNNAVPGIDATFKSLKDISTQVSEVSEAAKQEQSDQD